MLKGTGGRMTELLQRFTYRRTLDEDQVVKRVVLLGDIDGNDAILTLERPVFAGIDQDDGVGRYTGLQIDAIASNDVYHWGKALGVSNIGKNPTCKYNLIYPATETHIRKYESCQLYMVRETPEVYRKVVKPYIESMKGDRIQWVKNILYNDAESERVLVKNDDYILLPDMKWDGIDVNTLYCCCIVYDDTISSIRDLNKGRVKYLEKIRNSLLDEVSRIYGSHGLTRGSLRLYVHYQPSYYHFHIHIVNANFFGLTNSMLAGKAILLDDVIDNLRCMPDGCGYAEKVLTYQLKETHQLWELGLKDCVE